MKTLTYFLGIIISAFVLNIFILAQDAKQNSVNWNKLKFDVTPPKEATSLFGKPIKDKDRVSLTNENFAILWLYSSKPSEKTFRLLKYKDLEGYKQVRLLFFENKLVAVSLQPPNPLLEKDYVDPDKIGELFPIKFKPLKLSGWWTKTPSLEDFLTKSPDDLKKAEYDYWYSMVGVADNCFIVADVDNYKYIEGLFDRHKEEHKRRKEIDAGGKYPGFVTDIQLISRSLEKK